MLPAGSYRLSDDAVTIAEGTNVSTPSSFEIVSMDDFDEGAHYCVPLKITGTSNGMGVLEASRTRTSSSARSPPRAASTCRTAGT